MRRIRRVLVILYPYFILVGGLIIVFTDHGPTVHCIVCNGKSALLNLGDPLMTIIGAILVLVGVVGAGLQVMASGRTGRSARGGPSGTPPG
jgi:hypothetical protein